MTMKAEGVGGEKAREPEPAWRVCRGDGITVRGGRSGRWGMNGGGLGMLHVQVIMLELIGARVAMVAVLLGRKQGRRRCTTLSRGIPEFVEGFHSRSRGTCSDACSWGRRVLVWSER